MIRTFSENLMYLRLFFLSYNEKQNRLFCILGIFVFRTPKVTTSFTFLPEKCC